MPVFSCSYKSIYGPDKTKKKGIGWGIISKVKDLCGEVKGMVGRGIKLLSGMICDGGDVGGE